MFTLAHNVDTYTDIASCEALRGEVWRIAEEEAHAADDIGTGARDASTALAAAGQQHARCGKDDADFDDTRICCICKHVLRVHRRPQLLNDQLVCLRHAGFLCRCPPSAASCSRKADPSGSRAASTRSWRSSGRAVRAAVVDWPMMPRTENPAPLFLVDQTSSA